MNLHTSPDYRPLPGTWCCKQCATLNDPECGRCDWCEADQDGNEAKGEDK